MKPAAGMLGSPGEQIATLKTKPRLHGSGSRLNADLNSGRVVAGRSVELAGGRYARIPDANRQLQIIGRGSADAALLAQGPSERCR